jgi:uncharacterized protein YeaO (DUF488 family)
MTRTQGKHPEISIRRAYENPAPEDGYRVLVDRLWPRGRSKETLQLALWARELAPTAELRKWFGHEAGRWDAFKERYRRELAAEDKQEQMRQLLANAKGSSITLVYGAKDQEHNQAVVLREALSDLLMHSARR